MSVRAKKQKLDQIETLKTGIPVYIDIEDTPTPAPVHKEVEEPEKVIPPVQEPEVEEEPEEKVIPKAPEPEKITEPVEKEVTPASEEPDEFDYLSSPGKRDTAAVTRAKIEGKRRKELEKELETIKAEHEVAMREMELKLSEVSVKPDNGRGVNLDTHPEFLQLRETVGENLRRMKLSSADPKWVSDNYAEMIQGYRTSLEQGDESFVKFRDGVSAKTGLDASAVVSILGEAAGLATKAEKLAISLEERSKEGTLNETFSSYDKGVKSTMTTLDNFKSTLETRAEADEGSIYDFLNENLKTDEGQSAFKKIESDLVVLLHGPQQYSSDQLAKLKASGADIEMLKNTNSKKAQARLSALIPSVAAGLFVLTQFKDIYNKAKALDDEEDGVKELKKAGKSKIIEIKPPEPKKEKSAMESFMEMYGHRG